MNDTIRLLMNHRSIRSYKPDAVTDEQLEAIVAAGQMASSSSNVQAYSVIAVKDPERKASLARMAGSQRYIEECPVFLVWCADLYRLEHAVQKHAPEKESYVDAVENFIVATADVTLAAQNAAIAAESMGLGVVYIGGIRTDIEGVSELLGLPEYVYPIYGMCLGYPNQEPGLRPRLPLKAVLHREAYDADATLQAVEEYDDTMVQYLTERTGGIKTTPWSEQMAQKFTTPSRMQLKEFLEKKGFNKR
ncbi:oxygen-insensitive NADPH nitroreductase [Paenibacillus hunanensis]|uniref:FMN reductase (NADPH) n=1 Tax=Paenibacillus hunanensis TaxID=539262 RepID=A0ABU1IXN2_9BACL|nr:oxygen-insensitive NADPH nitroreductase [Paenibacillus hunanensis]MDR6244022.1 FMN reductase (NADPH) [Paenibacillus hunanensis]GGJ15173.1 NADPH-dependent oxidoreductase [Paenibacillus hunanensis]